MPEAPQPVLVYNRIASNVRKTRMLVASLAVLLLPVVSAAAVLAFPVISVVTMFAVSRLLGPEEVLREMLSMEADLQATRAVDGPVRLQDLPSSFVWLAGGLLLAALVLTAIALAAVTAFLMSRYGSRMLLRAAHARPIGTDEHQDLIRVVENLCIGAGLPMPRLYMVESSSPNAFATGRDPQHASLVVTHGLLTLLDRRELQGVIAHELSHIGNHDTKLMTLVAALVGTTSLPWKVGFAWMAHAFRISRLVGLLFAFVAFFFGSALVQAVWQGASYLASDEVTELPPFMWWWVAHAMLAPAYALFVAPVLALVVRQAVSRERELLADADAVRLTRDPEGLALALVKIGTAVGQRLRVGEGSVHLYIIDPRDPGSLLHKVFPSHPPLDERLELLANMGSGIAKSDVTAAMAAVRQTQQAASFAPKSSRRAEADEQIAVSLPEDETDVARQPSAPVDQQQDQYTRRSIPLYERPDGWSKVLAQLEEDDALTLVGKAGNFVRVVTADNVCGYVPSSAELTALRDVVDRPEQPHRS